MPRGAGKASGKTGAATQSTNKQQSPSPRATSTAAATASSSQNEGANYLIALAGVKALGSHIQDSSKGRKWKDRVASWEERASLGLPSVKLALGFLDVLGVSKTQDPAPRVACRSRDGAAMDVTVSRSIEAFM